MPDIVISEFMDEQAIADALGGFDVHYDPTLVDRPDALLELTTGTRAIIVRNRTQMRGALLDMARRLEVVGRLGVGLDNIDVDACRSRGIAVCPATGANDLAVAEYVISSAMMLMRGAYRATDDVAAGLWPRNRLMGRELSGKILGLVGFGAIARETARRAQSLGMSVAACDPHIEATDPAWSPAGGAIERLDFDRLLATSDVVSLHVPLTQETRGLLGRNALAKMKPEAILVNAARGGIVDEEALAECLRARRLGGAALDVFEVEPLSAAAGARFAECPNLLLTPHIAGVTVESNTRVSFAVAQAVARLLQGP
jgi:(S)-sulfolactate dehydrogenase